eukprot:TRINITY_DN430_c0_g1_i1.p1 TRINITY_DN430_c0_g1~~TRINITY_DN430_c0_g1_i1.p1  ORF type:complete len:268 (+),score=17.33 TRINITY_DN430_c0_g1_i1:54-806(+)
MAACHALSLSTSLSSFSTALAEKSLTGRGITPCELWALPLFTSGQHSPFSPYGLSKLARFHRCSPRGAARKTASVSCQYGSPLGEASVKESDNISEKAAPLPELKDSRVQQKCKLPRHAAPAVAVLVAAAMLLGNPSEGLAASSGGRVGGSKFKSSAPSRSYSPPRSGGGGGSRSYNNYNLNINPPTYAPPIYGGGYGGYSYGVPFFGGGVPFFGPSVYVGGGGLLQFILVPIVLYVVLNVVGSFFRNRD